MTTIIGGAPFLLPALIGVTGLDFSHRPSLLAELVARWQQVARGVT